MISQSLGSEPKLFIRHFRIKFGSHIFRMCVGDSCSRLISVACFIKVQFINYDCREECPHQFYICLNPFSILRTKITVSVRRFATFSPVSECIRPLKSSLFESLNCTLSFLMRYKEYSFLTQKLKSSLFPFECSLSAQAAPFLCCTVAPSCRPWCLQEPHGQDITRQGRGGSRDIHVDGSAKI